MALPFRRYLVGFHTMDLPHLFADVLVIGSGVAGLRAAIEAAASGRVLLVTKGALRDSNTRYAQGGIAVPMEDEETDEEQALQSHLEDTLRVGCGLCDPEVAGQIVQDAPRAFEELLEWGAAFDRTDGGRLARTREGGHSLARVFHAGGDATGLEIANTLIATARRTERLTLLDHTFAVDLLTSEGRVRGALVWRPEAGLTVICARATILASGGAGQLYRETTNPEVATGDGIAMAFRAGAKVRDLEFMQFHPTTLYVAGAARALISEAVRGEGGYLKDASKERFMPAIHPRAELAPRDVVSRSIVARMRQTGDTSVYLHLDHLEPDRVRSRFPFIRELCASFGIDIATDPIPVRPSAHYLIGGIVADLDGHTTLPGLYACGEVSSTGFHGANRLASNSLLEGLVVGRRVGRAVGTEAADRTELPRAVFQESPPGRRDELIDVDDLRRALKSALWRGAGIERSEEGLRRTARSLDGWARYLLPHEFDAPQGWELQNLLLLGRLVLLGALTRKESRGTHYRVDYPDTLTELAVHLEYVDQDLTEGGTSR